MCSILYFIYTKSLLFDLLVTQKLIILEWLMENLQG